MTCLSLRCFDDVTKKILVVVFLLSIRTSVCVLRNLEWERVSELKYETGKNGT